MSIDYDALPLGKVSDSQLARQLGVSPSSVREARIRRGIDAWTQTDVDWDAVDWTKNDSQLGRELGVSRQAVAYQRKRREPA